MNKKTEVKFVFDNQEAADHFITWLCESGEQSYWDWMEYREEEEAGDITAISFDYWGGSTDGDNFGKGDIIAHCGRLVDDDNT